MLSMMPDTMASSFVTPFPCETDRERARGRTTVITGIPIVSSPVTSAIRVIPIESFLSGPLAYCAAANLDRIHRIALELHGTVLASSQRVGCHLLSWGMSELLTRN